MTRLDRSQILVGVQPAYGVSHFDKSGDSRGGGNGGNAQGFAPGGALYGVYSATPDLKLGLSLGSYFAGSLQYQDGWSGRFYAHQVRDPDLRRLPDRGLPDQPLALGRRRGADPLRQDQREGRRPEHHRRRRQLPGRPERRRLRRHGRRPARADQDHPLRRHLHLPGRLQVQGHRPAHRRRADPDHAAAAAGLRQQEHRPQLHRAAAGDGQRLPRADRPARRHGQRRLAGLEPVRRGGGPGELGQPSAGPRTSTTTTPGASRSARSTSCRTRGPGRSASPTTPRR